MSLETIVQVFFTINDSDMPVESSWRRNEKPVANFFGISFCAAVRGGSILPFESLQFEHMGNYSCNYCMSIR